MIGVFSRWQPRYARHKIATFPVTADKKPATKGYLRTGIRYSTELAEKFTDTNALGFACGPSSKITLVDVDTKDEKVLADALATYGETPVLSRTPSGGHHAWYRHNGERRRIKPAQDVPIDILGGGYAVAPPSQIAKGNYEFIQGGLDDLDRLPTIRSPAVEAVVTTTTDTPVAWREMRIGDGRNNELFRYSLAAAPDCRTVEELVGLARAANQYFKEPIMDLVEIEKSARQAWKYQIEDRNFLVRPRVQLAHDIVDTVAASFPDAIALLLFWSAITQVTIPSSSPTQWRTSLAGHCPASETPATICKQRVSFDVCIVAAAVHMTRPAMHGQPSKVYDFRYQYKLHLSLRSLPRSGQ